MQRFKPQKLQKLLYSMKPAHLLFPLLVFLGGCSFGPSSPIIKLAYGEGFSASDVVMSQYFFGWVMVAILSLGLVLVSRRKRSESEIRVKKPFGWKNVFGIAVVGFSIAMVSTCYIFALQTVPAHIAVILLFQYTWMDIIVEAVYTRKLPKLSIVTSVVILIAGTLLAAGVGAGAETLDPIGILFGLGSAFFYAIYIFLLGKVDVEVHPLIRSFCILTFALLLLVIIFTPAYFTSGVIFDGLWKYGLLLGSFGCAVPMFLFAIGTPKISTGAATILSSSELPAGIIAAVIILSEAVTPLQWVGVCMLFFGIAFPYLAEWVFGKRGAAL